MLFLQNNGRLLLHHLQCLLLQYLLCFLKFKMGTKCLAECFGDFIKSLDLGVPLLKMFPPCLDLSISQKYNRDISWRDDPPY